MTLLRKLLLSTLSLFFMVCVTSKVFSTEEKLGKAIFAGGCFWCMESDFEKISGIKEVISGYIGGTKKNPSYKNYSKSGHIEAIHISYKPSVISYSELLEIFWVNIDPTDKNGQFCDRGHEYSTAVFYFSTKQKQLAEESKTLLEKSGILKESVQTPIILASEFYPAEEYHQNFYKKNSLKYQYYRLRCGRDQRLKELWGKKINDPKILKKTSNYQKPNLDELEKILTPLQFKVTQKNGTEQPFRNEYWNNEREGIYVDLVSGEPLFSSKDKYKSGTGWPSFTRPIKGAGIILKEDISWLSVRIELRSKKADSHLGHLFNDGPKPDGLRYCINSAALRFVSKNDMGKEGYHSYLNLFQ